MFWSVIPIFCLYTYMPSRSVGDIGKGKLTFWNLHNSFYYYLYFYINSTTNPAQFRWNWAGLATSKWLPRYFSYFQHTFFNKEIDVTNLQPKIEGDQRGLIQHHWHHCTGILTMHFPEIHWKQNVQDSFQKFMNQRGSLPGGMYKYTNAGKTPQVHHCSFRREHEYKRRTGTPQLLLHYIHPSPPP